jgi:hypothetical protein
MTIRGGSAIQTGYCYSILCYAAVREGAPRASSCAVLRLVGLAGDR